MTDPKNDKDLLLRLVTEDTALRDQSVRNVATGDDDYDYRQMWGLLVALMSRLNALASDPTAFFANGQHDIGMYKAWKGLVDSAAKIISDINKMRNSDRLTMHILREHTAQYTRALAQPIAAALREFDERLRSLENLSTSGQLTGAQTSAQVASIRQDIQAFVARKLPKVFSDVAVSTLNKSQNEFKLH